jgi:hypothetical protein
VNGLRQVLCISREVARRTAIQAEYLSANLEAVMQFFAAINRP